MSGKRQHYLPASLLGGFGERAPTAKSREAKLVARRKATGRVDRGTCKAENEAFRIGMYRLAAPPPGVDRDIIDRLWNPVEGALPDLIRRLTDGKLSRGDDQLLFSYVAMAAVRHLSFEDVAKDWQNRHGGAPPVGDQVQLMRAEGLRNQLAQLVLWRWRVLHVPTDVSQLMVTDRGWMYVGEPERQDHSLFLPMGPRVALLGYLDSADLPLDARPSRSTETSA